MTHRQCAVPACLRVASAGGAESIILSAGGTESLKLSAFAESMILSVPVITTVVVAATDIKSIPTTTFSSAAPIVTAFSGAAFS